MQKMNMLSLGIAKQENSIEEYSPRRYNDGRSNDKAAAFKQQLDADANRSACTESRKPYVRKQDNDPGYSGFTIGNVVDEDTQKRNKHVAQAEYRRQLAQDKYVHNQTTQNQDDQSNRKPLRKNESPDPIDRAPQRNAQENAQRREQVMDRLSNRSDVVKIISNDISSKRNHKAAAVKDGECFEIGESREDAKARKEAMQREYLAQLDNDCGGRPKQEPRNNRQYLTDDTYINAVGLTGLSIGGPARDMNSASHKNFELSNKQHKQAEYRRLLLEQQALSNDLKRRTKEEMQDDTDYGAPLPYMKY